MYGNITSRQSHSHRRRFDLNPVVFGFPVMFVLSSQVLQLVQSCWAYLSECVMHHDLSQVETLSYKVNESAMCNGNQ